MNNKRNTLLVIGLISLALFATIVAVMMYWKTTEVHHNAQNLVSVYVTKIPIHRGEIISMEKLEIKNVASDTPGAKKLAIADIIGKYANEDIASQEILRHEKLSQTPLLTHAETLSNKDEADDMGDKDTIVIPSEMFKNFDEGLKIGDRIDILGVETILLSDTRRVESRYVATDVEVRKIITTQSHPKGEVDESSSSKTLPSSKIVLSMSPTQLSRFLRYYYQSLPLNQERPYNPDNHFNGHLWIVKTINDASQTAEKMGLMGNGSQPIKPSRVVRQPLISPSKPKAQSGVVMYEQ